MKKTLLLLLASVLLSACVSHPKATWPAPDKPLDHYEVTGKVAILTDKSRDSANLYWQQDEKDYYLQLTTFLGTQVLAMESKAGQVSLTNRNGTYHDTDAQRLLYRLSGWQIPVNDLPQWLKGNAGAQGQIVAKDKQGRIATLQSQGWTIQYQGWSRQGGRELPTKLDLRKDNIRIKLQIDQWQPR
ncbi:lipoprotein insertase outer membrane protein LolB [Gallaecimonas mangrovi]|uniref:lipoprotein insertase outer membrane protein LolB n=1 Tax=Gallaecimonas mangrovi TaxID=2291597 RepID=UPI001866C475|nr:lipoprotein insertase outer membrane protein LolB [Gallaecimonas mangrovi]